MKNKILLLFVIFTYINIQAQNQEFTTYNSGTSFASITVDETNQRVWAATAFGEGLYKIEMSQEIVPTSFSEFHVGSVPEYNTVTINGLAMDNDGNLVVGHDGLMFTNYEGATYAGHLGGINIINNNFERKWYGAANPMVPLLGGGLGSKRVNSLAVDKNGTIWVAQKAAFWWDTVNAQIHQDFIYHGALSRKKADDWKFRAPGTLYDTFIAGNSQQVELPTALHYIPSGSNPPHREFFAVSTDDTEVWTSVDAYISFGVSLPGRILRYNLSGNFLGEFSFSSIGLSGKINNICRNNELGTWVASFVGGGFSVYKNDTWTHMNSGNFPNVIPPNTYFSRNSMWKDRNGKVYMGTTNGLIVYNGVGAVDDESSYKLYTNYDFGADPLHENYDSYVFDETMVSKNILGGCTDPNDSRINWITTIDGIMKMGARDGIVLLHLKDYTTYDSSSINQDGSNNIEFLAELPNVELPEEQMPMIAADGSSSTVFRIYTDTPGNFYGDNPVYTPKIFIENESGDNETEDDIKRFGKFTPKDLSSYNINGATTDAEILSDMKYVDFIYQHPDHIEEIDYEINEIYELINFKIIDQNNTEIESRNLKIAIPPILLGHGVWSSVHSLKGMENFLYNGMKFPKYAVSKFWRTIDESSKQNPENSFQEDSSIIPTKIKEIKDNSRKNKFSAGKVNVIVHSRGGLYTRGYIEEVDLTYPYKHDINSLITVDTPHFGSQGGNIALDWRNIVSTRTIINSFVASIASGSIIPSVIIVSSDELTIGGLTSLGSVPMKDNPRFAFGGENWGARNLIVENDNISGITSHNEDPGFIQTLNSPYFLNKLNGTPIHTISSSCNPCVSKPLLCLDPAGLQEITSSKVLGLMVLRGAISTLINVDDGINSVTDALFNGEENDFIVPYTSMTGGLSGNYNTHFGGGQGNLNLDHTGMFSVGIMNHPDVHTEIKELLMTNVNDESPNGLFTKNGIVNHPRTYNFLADILDPALNKRNEEFTSKILINRDPVIFDGRIEGDMLNFNVYQEEVDRIMITYQGENNFDNFDYEIKSENISFENSFTYTIPQGHSGELTITAYGYKNGVVGVAKSVVTLDVGTPADVTLQSIHFTTEEPVILEQDQYNYTIKGTYSDGVDRIINNEDITFTIENTYVLTSVDSNSVKGESIGASLLKAEIDGFEDTVKVKVRSNSSLQQTILTNLYAIPNDDNSEIVVNWETLHEFENATFSLESSYNTPDNFTEINNQPGNGTFNDPAQFNYTDDSFGSNTVIYYRLKLTSVNGDITYSPIIEINFSTSDTHNSVVADSKLSLFPNPTNSNQVSLQFDSPFVDSKTKLEMFNIQGKRINKQLINVAQGNNIYKLNIENYLSGIYFIRITTKEYIKTVKLIIE